jgi:hypothetical protein
MPRRGKRSESVEPRPSRTIVLNCQTKCVCGEMHQWLLSANRRLKEQIRVKDEQIRDLIFRKENNLWPTYDDSPISSDSGILQRDPS